MMSSHEKACLAKEFADSRPLRQLASRQRDGVDGEGNGLYRLQGGKMEQIISCAHNLAVALVAKASFQIRSCQRQDESLSVQLCDQNAHPGSRLKCRCRTQRHAMAVLLRVAIVG
jgi:hypothetical protein